MRAQPSPGRNSLTLIYAIAQIENARKDEIAGLSARARVHKFERRLVSASRERPQGVNATKAVAAFASPRLITTESLRNAGEGPHPDAAAAPIHWQFAGPAIPRPHNRLI